MEDRRAHERLDKVEGDISTLKQSLIDNTRATEVIASNTSEMVDLMKTAKGLMTLITLLAKVGVAVGTIYVLWHQFLQYLRGN